MISDFWFLNDKYFWKTMITNSKWSLNLNFSFRRIFKIVRQLNKLQVFLKFCSSKEIQQEYVLYFGVSKLNNFNLFATFDHDWNILQPPSWKKVLQTCFCFLWEFEINVEWNRTLWKSEIAQRQLKNVEQTKRLQNSH